MGERNITTFNINQAGNNYILTSSILNGKLKFTCQDSNSQIFSAGISLKEQLNLTEYFGTRSIDQVQQYINEFIENQAMEIYQDNYCINIKLFFFNDYVLLINLKKLINQNTNFYDMRTPSNITDITNYSNKVNYTDPQTISYKENNNYLRKQIKEIKKNYESKISELQKKLNKKKEKNKTLIDENNLLKEKINKLNAKIGKLEDIVKLLKSKLSQKDIEIQKMLQNNSGNHEITSINKGEKIMSVNFVSMGISDIGHYSLFCKNTDLFVKLEERLYEDFPQFKEYETYFEVKTKRLKRFKTLKENKIKNNDIINMFIIDN